MSTPFEKAMTAIDAAHSTDPRKISSTGGLQVPYELHYAQKMSKYLSLRTDNASEALQLAIRGQHFRRWEIPRSDYPMNKVGYYAWRTFLKKRQAEQVSEICKESGLDQEVCERVAALIRKEDLGTDEETKALEDVACLVFLDDQFEEFEKGYDEEKVIQILKRTWGKMSEKGHNLALQIPMSDKAKGLVGKAITPQS
jgi:hypothetical protein